MSVSTVVKPTLGENVSEGTSGTTMKLHPRLNFLRRSSIPVISVESLMQRARFSSDTSD